MIEPTKHEQLKQNILVLGSGIIRSIKSEPINIEEVFQQFKIENQDSAIDKFYDTLTFLWLMNFIKIETGIISLNRPYNVFEKTIF